MECKTDENQLKYCNCTYSCSKKGRCCDCLHYHRNRGELPACYFPNDVEQSYDRSIQQFISLHQ